MTENEKNILEYVEKCNLSGSSRKSGKVDQRSYIAGYLHYKYGWSEKDIGKLFGGRDHSTVNWMKTKPYFQLKVKDQIFLSHTKYLRDNFPYVFPKPKKAYKSGLKAQGTVKNIVVKLNSAHVEKMEKFIETLSVKSYSHAVRELIDNHL